MSVLLSFLEARPVSPSLRVPGAQPRRNSGSSLKEGRYFTCAANNPPIHMLFDVLVDFGVGDFVLALVRNFREDLGRAPTDDGEDEEVDEAE